MLLQIPNVLNANEVARCRAWLDEAPAADWADGRITAGTQSAQVKNNRQLREDCATAQRAQALMLQALGNNGQFFAAALPRRIFPPLFNRYEGAANAFGNHIDNAVRTHAASGQHVRTDLSATLFLAAPEEYEGGALVIEDHLGTHAVKLAAGSMVLYPASSLHRVEPVTRGCRLACFFWVQSMVRSAEQRRMLLEMDSAIVDLRARLGEVDAVVQLTGCYHNLLRMWADV